MALALSLLALVPAREARAYLIDANDAAVLDHGRMAIELQPLGYWQTVIGEEEHYLVAPSLQAYWGLSPGWDILYLSRGWGLLDDVPDQDRYAIQEQMIAFRAMLRDGSYGSDGEIEGPSVTLQVGLFVPDIQGDPAFGASLALLMSHQFEAGTLHLNAWANLTPELTFELFASAVIEGPPAWPARPTVEVWFDLNDGEPLVSGLAGLVVDVTDDFLLQGGVRMSGWEGWLDLEVRLSSWIEWEAWDPGPSADDEEDEPRAREADEEEEGDASPVRRGPVRRGPVRRGPVRRGLEPV